MSAFGCGALLPPSKPPETIMLRFLNDENGATAIEYGLIAALIAVVIIGAVSALGTSVSSTFDTISGALNSATSSVGTAS